MQNLNAACQPLYLEVEPNRSDVGPYLHMALGKSWGLSSLSFLIHERGSFYHMPP